MFKSLPIVAGALVLAGAMSLSHPAAAQGRSFEVVNTNGDVSVVRVFTAIAGTSDYWHDATLNRPVFPGYETSFTLGYGSTCYYDIKVRFSDGVEQTFNNVNVCSGDRVIAS